MPNLVCSGATFQCSLGTTPATFAASGTRVSARGQTGVVTDVSAENVPDVPPFGLCTSELNPRVAEATEAAGGDLVPQPCEPVLSRWSQGSARVTIGKVGALHQSSECKCLWQGVVTVSAAGQTAASVQ